MYSLIRDYKNGKHDKLVIIRWNKLSLMGLTSSKILIFCCFISNTIQAFIIHVYNIPWRCLKFKLVLKMKKITVCKLPNYWAIIFFQCIAISFNQGSQSFQQPPSPLFHSPFPQSKFLRALGEIEEGKRVDSGLEREWSYSQPSARPLL